MNKLTEQEASPVFGLRYLEDREVEGLDVVGCLIIDRGGLGLRLHGDRVRRRRPDRPVTEACRRRAPAARFAPTTGHAGGGVNPSGMRVLPDPADPSLVDESNGQ